MKSTRIASVFLGTVLVFLEGTGYPAETRDLGKMQYEQNCAICHGAAGKGEGSFGDLLKSSVPDLTTLSRRNGGVFPVTRVYETIDGTQVVKAHGTRDMPIWGKEYKIRAAEHYVDVPYDEATFVRARILALVEYIYRLQAK